MALQRDPDAVILMLAADHWVGDGVAFRDSVLFAGLSAKAGWLVVFRVSATSSPTEFGYISAGDPIDQDGLHRVAQFTEKPSAELAAEFVARGFLWNTGNLIFRASDLLEEVSRLQATVFGSTRAAFLTARKVPGGLLLDPEAFTGCPSMSVDTAILERYVRTVVLPVFL